MSSNNPIGTGGINGIISSLPIGSNSAHTLNPVPLFIIDNHWKGKITPGKLGDIAPTILTMMQLPIPPEMKGNILI